MVLPFKTILGTTYLATLEICVSTPPIPELTFTSKSKLLSLESFIASYVFDICNSTLSPDASSSTSISAPTNCFASAV